MEVCKAILAAQRDHGNREVRANARMKYLVHSLGIDAFRTLVESYLGKKVGVAGRLFFVFERASICLSTSSFPLLMTIPRISWVYFAGKDRALA